jgi:SAM-dependent methyltransferase
MSDTPHLGGAHPDGDGNTAMPDVWGYLIVKYDPHRFLDIGCGYGHTMKFFHDYSIAVTGIEGLPEAVAGNVVRAETMQHDFTTGPAPLCSPYDLGWAAEFLEHLDEQYLPNVFPAFRLCRHVVITHGEPGQGGHNHVNCQPSSYWVRQFHAHGFQHNEQETFLLRRTDRHNAPWGRRTLMFFDRL